MNINIMKTRNTANINNIKELIKASNKMDELIVLNREEMNNMNTNTETNTNAITNTVNEDTTNNNATKKEGANNMDNHIFLNKETVEINGYTREVGIKIMGDRLIGVINKTPFVWEINKYELPILKIQDSTARMKAARYGRLYILKRLEMANITLNIKTREKKVKYINIPLSNGVWINVFENGYMRGAIDGNPFVWEAIKYKDAVRVDEAGFKGNITQYADTNRIKARLLEAGYDSVKALIKAVAGTTTPTPSKPKSVEIVNNDDLTVVAYNNGDVKGTVNGKAFSWNYKTNKITDLHDSVKEAIKTVAATPKALIDYVNNKIAEEYVA